MLSLDKIKSATDCPVEFVPLPEWGMQEDGTPDGLYVRRMSADAYAAKLKHWWQGLQEEDRTLGRWWAVNIAFAACDAAGKPAFDNPPAAAKTFSAKASDPVVRLWDVVARLNNLRETDNEARAKN